MTIEDPVSVTDKIKALRGNLPDLRFNTEQDAAIFATEGGSAYRDFYLLRHNESIKRGLGALELQGYRVAVHYFIPEQAEATLVVAHGLYDHIGIYHQAVEWALEANMAVIAFDSPGHGLSGGDEVAIDSFDAYSDILAQLIETTAQHPALFPQPLHGLGQSTGSATWLNLLWRHPAIGQQIEKRLLLAPLVLPRGWFIGRLSYRLMKRFRQYIARGKSYSSHNRAMLDFINVQDPLQSRLLSLRWVGAMQEFALRFRALAARDDALLVIQGTKDQTLAWQYNVKIIKEKLPNAQIAYIAGADHQLLNENDEYLAKVRQLMTDYLTS